MKRKRKVRMVSVHVLIPRPDYLALTGIRENVGVSVGSSIRLAIQTFIKENKYGYFRKENHATGTEQGFCRIRALQADAGECHTSSRVIALCKTRIAKGEIGAIPEGSQFGTADSYLADPIEIRLTLDRLV